MNDDVLIESKLKEQNFLKLQAVTYFHGVCLFLISYVVVFLIHSLSSAVFAVAAQKKPVIFHNKILFLNTTGWNLYDALTIYGSPLIIVGLFALYLFTFFRKTNSSYTLQKPFIFWLLMHSLSRFVGCVIPGMISNESFKYMADWLYVGPYGMFILAVVSVLLLFIIGGYLTKYALQSAVYEISIKTKNRTKFLSHAYFFPWMTGSLTIIALQAPDLRASLHEITTALLICLIIVPMYYMLKTLNKKPVARKKPSFSSAQLNWKLVLYTILILFSFRSILGNGIYF